MAATAGTAAADIDRSEWSAAHDPVARSNVYRATASGAQTLPRYVDTIELVHATKIEITIPDLSYHPGKIWIIQTGSGTAGHTVTATVGSFDGTNNILTFDAVKESWEGMIDTWGNGTLTLNTGTVGATATA